jgi:hypothetical protein
MRAATCILALLLTSNAAAQETSAFKLPHPQTGESGVWIPVWLQQEFLATEADLESCRKLESELSAQAASLRAANTDLKLAASSLQTASNALEVQLVSARRDARSAEVRADGFLYWALGATGIAIATSVTLALVGL